MEATKFVHQLYDDASFSRSRFYFWAIGCLSVFEEMIIANRKNISTFLEQYIPESEREWKSDNSSQIKFFKEMDQKLKGSSQEMEDVRVHVARKLVEIKALRDSVSGIIYPI